jgi:hypothetical protein
VPTLAGRACASLCDIATQTDRRLSIFALVTYDIPLKLASGPSAATFKISMAASPSCDDPYRTFGTWLKWRSVYRLYDKGTILHQFDQEAGWLR